MKKRFLSMLLCLCMVLGLLPVTVMAVDTVGDFTVSGGTLNTDYTYENHVLTVISGTQLTISGVTTADRIEVAVAQNVTAYITLNRVNIDVSASNTAAFKIADNCAGNVVIELENENVLKSGKLCAGLQKSGGTGNLNIVGTGSLTAIGGDYGAGIGGGGSSSENGSGGSGSDISISDNTTITATGGNYGAGIGGGGNSSKNGSGGSGSNITISGGTVIAKGGEAGAGIGGGGISPADGGGIMSSSNIAISGGSVKASLAGCTPTNGIKKVYLLTIKNPDGKDVYINSGTPYKPSNHSAADKNDTNLYVYLPAATAQSPSVVTVGENTTKYCYDTKNSKWLEVVDIPGADSSSYIYNGTSQTYQIAESDYYTVAGNAQTNAGNYTVTVSLNDTENTVWSDGTTANKEYTFTIKQKSAPVVDDINTAYNWGVTGNQTATVSGFPDNMGSLGEITAELTSDDNSILVSDSLSFDKDSNELSYALSSNTREKIGSTATIQITVPSQNYENIICNVIVKITDKISHDDKPECTLTLSYDSSNQCTATITAVDGAEYSFDGTSWSGDNTKAIAHGETVTGYIRYKETADFNASDKNSASETAGHGTLTHHDAVAATTSATGNKEYWYCSECEKYFSDADGKNEFPNGIDDVTIPKLKIVFEDVPSDAYYAEAVEWAILNNVTEGKDDTHFCPDDTCTRAEAVTFLWRAAGKPKPESTTLKFKDVPKDAYYYDAVLWAVDKGITKGTTKDTFSPDETCNRAQAVTLLWRYQGSLKVTGENPFDDVSENRFYSDAVLWAAQAEVTKGTTKNTFSPNRDCSRAQIVTFLWRSIAK